MPKIHLPGQLPGVRKFCSMRISHDLRAYAEEHGVTVGDAIELGMKEKASEFDDRGRQVYLTEKPT